MVDPILSELGLVHIKDATIEAVKEIKDRKDGKIFGLKTRWVKFNTLIGGSVEWNSLFSLGGISGSGKSSIANELETSFFDYNPNENFVVLSFNYEMSNKNQVIRKVSFKTKMTTSEIKSGNSPISDSQYESVKKAAKEIVNYRIYYAEKPKTPEEMIETIRKFHQWCKTKYGEDCGLVILFDHTRLSKKKAGLNEQEMIDTLQNLFIEAKKEDKRIIIQLTQLNRNIESVERKQNPNDHYPNRGDIFKSDSIYQSSDIVVISHRPEIINISSYGPYGYAVRNKVYLHAIKVREGEPAPIRFINNLKHNRIDEDPVPPSENESV
jgi:replicative DNA helicase